MISSADLAAFVNLSRKQIANLVGVAPRTYQSGKKESSGHIFGGSFYACKALYMIAFVASQHDAYLKEKYKQMIKMGKPKKVALVALMRNIIISLYAMLKKSQKCTFYSLLQRR